MVVNHFWLLPWVLVAVYVYYVYRLTERWRETIHMIVGKEEGERILKAAAKSHGSLGIGVAQQVATIQALKHKNLKRIESIKKRMASRDD